MAAKSASWLSHFKRKAVKLLDSAYMRTHQEIDARSLALHRLIADKIRRDPRLFGNVKETLSRWRASVCISSQPYLDEWDRLVSQGMEVCLSAAEEDSPHATALRQSSPFSAVLTYRERFSFLKAWSRSDETQGT